MHSCSKWHKLHAFSLRLCVSESPVMEPFFTTIRHSNEVDLSSHASLSVVLSSKGNAQMRSIYPETTATGGHAWWCNTPVRMLYSTDPEDFTELLRLYKPTRQLRSCSDTFILYIPTVGTHSLGQRSFSYAAPAVWNTHSYEIRSSNTTFRPVNRVAKVAQAV